MLDDILLCLKGIFRCCMCAVHRGPLIIQILSPAISITKGTERNIEFILHVMRLHGYISSWHLRQPYFP